MNYLIVPGLKTDEEIKESRTAKVIRTIIEYLGVNEEIIFKKCREVPIVYARQLIYKYLYEKVRLTKKSIGRVFNQDHTTVIHGLTTLSNLEETDPKVAADIQFLNKKIA